jgi:thiol:disulfide interchange protein DsbD
VVEIDPALTPVDIGAESSAGAASGLGAGAPRSGGTLGFLSGEGGLLGYLLGAVIGGLILNLMPCVFPVLFIKALGFAKRAHDAPGEVRRHGLVFLAGVLSTFLLLAGALIGLKAAGQQVGWGFQLQDPVFVAALALLMFTIGLNLMGAFEIGGGLQNLGSGLAAKGGDIGAFFTGVLAVVVATPCTAPFMAGAVGFALAQPAWASLAVFAALGVGLALPFVALSFAPGLLRLLPKPGPWMDTLKQLFAFPMFLTAVWLVWTLAQQSGAAGVGLVLLAMTALGFGVWVLRATSGRTGVGAWVGRGAAALFVIAALAGVAGQRGAVPAAEAASLAAVEEAAWSPEKVASLRAEGKSVFVDFTAAWCITCQFNKRVALTVLEVQAAFAAKNVVFLTADWTNRDDVIAAELERHGRSGVPLYLLYGPSGEPMILPQLLTPDIVIAAVEGHRG